MPRRSPDRRLLLTAVIALALVATACVSPDHSVQTQSIGPSSIPPVGASITPSTAPAGTAAPTTAPATTPKSLGPYKLTGWTNCGGGFQCASLPVPLDYAKPNGPKISLAVIRKPATGQRIGSVFMNPGGPGDPGRDFLRQMVSSNGVPAGLNSSFDLVSWDPRGTGASDGIRCLTTAQIESPDPDPVLDNAKAIAAFDQQERTFVDACKANAPQQLTRVGTKNTARDLDALRAALGDQKLTYVGYSYGTEIGQVYAEMFPTHIRAMVLDGVALVGANPVTDTFDQGASFEKDLEAFLADCQSRASCLFGDGNPRQAFLNLAQRFQAGLRLPGSYTLPDDQGNDINRSGTVGAGEFYTGVIVTLYSRDDWPDLEAALAAASNGDGKLLLSLRDEYDGRNDDGSWSHIGDANAAIACADQKLRPSNFAGDPALESKWSRELPLLGAVIASGTPGCTGFPPALEPLSPPTAASFKKVPPIVVVGSTGDPATPYVQAVDVAKLFPGSSLVTWVSDDHTAYGRGSSCLDGAVTRYLVTLQKPPAGLRCTP